MVWLHGSRAVQVVSQARKRASTEVSGFPPSASVSSQICAPTVAQIVLATARAHKKARSEGEHHTSLGSLAVVWPALASLESMLCACLSGKRQGSALPVADDKAAGLPETDGTRGARSPLPRPLPLPQPAARA